MAPAAAEAEAPAAPPDGGNFLADVNVELAQHLLRVTPFESATRLMCVSRHWASLASDDTTWRPLALVIAHEARLHYVPPASPNPSWRAECAALFAQRGIFVGTFGGRPTPLPPATSFSIRVGCRFRPVGGGAPTLEEARAMVLPLHQRLRFIMEAHSCSASEARRRLWASGSALEKSDPWETAEVSQPASSRSCASPVNDGAGAAPLGGDEKENCGRNGPASSGEVEGAEEVEATEEVEVVEVEAAPQAAVAVDDASAQGDDVEEGGGTASLASACGLISLGGGSAIVCAPGAGIRAFTFAHTWDEAATQREVYQDAVAPLVTGVLNGRSACVLAYGQTGSGKSHSMFGELLDERSDGQAGLVPRALRALLAAIHEREAGGMHATVSLACIEVFGDAVSDLLSTDGERRVGGFWQGVSAAATAAGYADVPVSCVGEALELLERAEGAKRRAATLMNERSSRAHSLVMATVEQQVGSEGRVRSQICLADLGGCEKVKRSGARGERLQEAIHINQGLLALKSVISALNQQRSYVPYQDDKMTMLLRRSLSGGAQTCVLLAARPEAEHATETLQALRFGESAMQVEVAAGGGGGRAAAAALEALDAQVAQLERLIVEKERFETTVERRVDQRAGLLDAAGFGAGLTDMAVEEKKVSRIVGAERERAQLEKVLLARRALLGE